MALKRLTVQARQGQPRNTRQEKLDNRVWLLSWYTSGVDDAWFLDIESDGGEQINGIPVSSRLDMLAPYRASDVPTGQLFVQTSTGRAPRQNDFSDGNAVAYYYEEGAS